MLKSKGLNTDAVRDSLATPDMQALNGKSIELFDLGFKTEKTKVNYTYSLAQFLKYCKLEPDEYLEKARERPRDAELLILRFMSERKKVVGGSTLKNTLASVRSFLVMNDISNSINWEKIQKIMPHAKKVGSDRAPTIDEIRVILDNSLIHIRNAILLMVSGGFRVGAFDYLTWRDVEAIKVGDYDFAKLTIYRGEPEQYTTFITPEAYGALQEYRKRREEIGEKIRPDSPLIRDTWDSRARIDPTQARPLSSQSVKNSVLITIWKVGLRKEHKKTQEFKAVHGFRKYFETNAKRVLRSDDVERLKGHLSNYYKPTEEYLASEYVKAIPFLTISESAELKTKIEQSVRERDQKIGELERENMFLRQRLDILDEKLSRLTETLSKKK